jgi:hypothetical protein
MEPIKKVKLLSSVLDQAKHNNDPNRKSINRITTVNNPLPDGQSMFDLVRGNESVKFACG